MHESEAFVVESFPKPDTMLSVMPVPGGAIGYHVGIYGTWWPTEPSARYLCATGGFVGNPDGECKIIAEEVEVA